MAKIKKISIVNDIVTYRCYSCKLFKEIEWFYATSKHFKNEQYQCKLCKRASSLKNYKYAGGKERQHKRYKEWTEEDKAYNAELQVKYYWKSIHRKKLYLAKQRADKLGLEFNLELSDIIIPEVCPYLEIPFIKGTKEEKWSTYSIDRIDPTKGYIKGNVQIISYLANTMKNKASKEQLVTFAKNILKFMT